MDRLKMDPNAKKGVNWTLIIVLAVLVLGLLVFLFTSNGPQTGTRTGVKAPAPVAK